MLKHKLKVGVDVDDVLYDCVNYVCHCINRDHPSDNPIKVEDFTDWSYATNPLYKHMYEYFKTDEFTYNQPIFKGAKEFIKKLNEIAEVFIITAVNYNVMSTRAKRLVSDFGIDPSHIILGSRKDLVELDIMLDDAVHNILESKARFPILFRRQWNQFLTGILSVHSYDEVIQIVETIENNDVKIENPRLICLVGPSGASKADTIKKMKEMGLVKALLSTTTRPMMEGEKQNENYEFITEEQYLEILRNNEFLERSVYAKHHYGIRASSIKEFMNSSNELGIISLDICGAIKLKSLYGNLVTTVFVKKDKKELIEKILSKKTTKDDHVNRILAIDTENKNRMLCDAVITNDDELIELIKKFKNGSFK